MQTETQIPAYHAIYEALRKEAETADSDGVRIASNRELAERFSVGQSTVVRAINLLKEEGWAYGRQGKGTYLCRRPEPAGISQITVIASALDADTAIYSKALDEVLDSERYSLAVCSTHADLNRYQQVVSHAGSLRPAGIIILSMPQEICPVDPQPLIDAGVPVVVIGEPIPGLICDRVVFAKENSAERAAHCALAQGHRNIGVFLSSPPREESASFLAGLRRELAEGGVELPDDHVFRFGISHGYSSNPDPYLDAQEQVAGLLSEGLSCKTLIFSHDYPAVGALRAILAAGIRVPEEMQVISGLRCSVEGATPMKLTTVASHRERQARLAGRLLMKRLGGYDGPSEVHYVDGELIKGETS